MFHGARGKLLLGGCEACNVDTAIWSNLTSLKVVRTSSARSADPAQIKLLEKPHYFLSVFRKVNILLWLPWKYHLGDFWTSSTAPKSRKTQTLQNLSEI